MDQRYQRAFILLQQHRYDDAESELRGVLAESPSAAFAHAMLAICISQHHDRADESLAEAAAAVMHDPNEAFGHYALSIAQLKTKAYRAASTAIDDAIRLDPLDSSYWAMRARCDFALERYPDMLASVRQGLQLNPESIDCRNLLSLALERTGAVRSSLDQAMETLRIDPDNDESHAMLGFAMLQNGQHLEARNAFREALRLNPMNEQARQGMMQAISSRSIVFRSVNHFYSWLNRMPAQRQMLILIGGWVLMRVLARVGESNSLIQLLTLPILLAYFVFAVLTWIATPLFQTFLRFHPFGRHLLRGPELRLSNFVAPCLLLAVVGAIVGAVTNDLSVAVGVAFYWLMATVVMVCVFNASQSRDRLKYLTFALAGVVLLGPLWGLLQSVRATSYEPYTATFQTSLWCFIGLQVLSGVFAVRNR